MKKNAQIERYEMFMNLIQEIFKAHITDYREFLEGLKECTSGNWENLQKDYEERIEILSKGLEVIEKNRFLTCWGSESSKQLLRVFLLLVKGKVEFYEEGFEGSSELLDAVDLLIRIA